MTWPSLIVFDLDGTLIDSAPDIHAAVNRMLERLGRPVLTLGQVKGMIGDGTYKLVERALAATGGGEVKQDAAHSIFIACYSEAPLVLTKPYPDVVETIERLHESGLKLAVCTNKPEAASRHILEALGIAGHLGAIIGGDSTPWRKPDPRGLLQLASALGAEPGDTILVGDSEVDAATAEAAGVTFVLMVDGYHRGPLKAIPHAALLHSMDALDASLLERLGNRGIALTGHDHAA